MLLKKIGPVEQANITLNNLTVFTGDNGTGKTLAAYAFYIFTKWFTEGFTFINRDELEKLVNEKHMTISYDSLKNSMIDKFKVDSTGYCNKTFMNEFMDDSKIWPNSDDVNSLFLNETTEFGINWEHNEDLRDPEGRDDNTVKRDIRSTIFFKLVGNKSLNLRYVVQDYSNEQKDVTKEYGTKNTFSRFAPDAVCSFLNHNIKERLFHVGCFFAPSERIGINLFRQELNTSRSNQLLESNKDDDSGLLSNFLSKKATSYPLPVNDYIKHLNDESLANQVITNNLSSSPLYKELVPGEFEFTSEKNIEYRLGEKKISFAMVSSSLKSLYGISIVLKEAKQNSWIFIDEPEMNLSPHRQKIIIDLLYKYAVEDSYCNIIISTHSDYMIKELMNLQLKAKVNKKSTDSVTTYNFCQHTVQNLGNLADTDTDLSNFDATTDEINSNYYSLIDKLGEED